MFNRLLIILLLGANSVFAQADSTSTENGLKNKITYSVLITTGYSNTWTGTPTGYPADWLSDEMSGFYLQTQLEIKYRIARSFKVGIGAGVAQRFGQYKFEDRSFFDGYYGLLQIHNPSKKVGLYTVGGISRGVVTNDYYPHVLIGPIIKSRNKRKAVDIQIMPTIYFSFGENTTNVAYDGRLGRPLAREYTLNYKTVMLNITCVVTLNFSQ